MTDIPTGRQHPDIIGDTGVDLSSLPPRPISNQIVRGKPVFRCEACDRVTIATLNEEGECGQCAGKVPPPTPEEIARATEEIRREWPPERLHRLRRD